MGRSPQVMEDQVTYPLVSNLQGIPKIKTFVALPCSGWVLCMWFLRIMLTFIGQGQEYWKGWIMHSDCFHRSYSFSWSGWHRCGHIFWYHLNAPNGFGRATGFAGLVYKVRLTNGARCSWSGFIWRIWKTPVSSGSVKLQYYNISLMDVMNKVKANNNDVGAENLKWLIWLISFVDWAILKVKKM